MHVAWHLILLYKGLFLMTRATRSTQLKYVSVTRTVAMIHQQLLLAAIKELVILQYYPLALDTHLLIDVLKPSPAELTHMHVLRHLIL